MTHRLALRKLGSRLVSSGRRLGIGIGLLSLLILGLSANGLALGASADAPSVVAPEVVDALQADSTTRVIIALENPLATTSALAERKERGQEAINRVLDALSSDEFQIKGKYEAFFAFTAEISSQALKILEEIPEVVRIHPDIEVRKPEPLQMSSAAVRAQLAESVPLMNADQVHSDGIDGSNVRIAVLDTGIDTDHADFGSGTTGDRIVAQNCFLDNISGSCPGSPNVAEDDEGHGTNVTGTAASDGSASPTGVAPASGIVAVKVLNSNGDGSFSDILAALEWIQDNNDTLGVNVVNMSLGGTPIAPPCDSDFPSMATAIEQLRAGGVITFAASGNASEANRIAPPGCISDAVSVGAVYDDDIGSINYSVCDDASTAADQVACFTNGAPDLQAPGAAMTASGLNGGTSTFFGTSQATPAAAGVAALLLDADASLTPDEIESALADTGVAVTDPKNGATRPRVDAGAAVDSVTGPSVPIAPSGLSATAASSSRIDLSWTDNSGNEDGFRILRDGAEIDTVGANTTSYADTGLNGDTQHCYEVVAFNAAGDSGASNEDCATTDAATSGSGAVFRVESDGDVYADGAYYCGLSSGCFNAGQGADIAERIDTSESVEPGDLIAIDPNHEVTFRKSRIAHSELVVGVVSTAPAITLGNTAAELRALMNRPVIRPNRSAWVGRLVNADSDPEMAIVGAHGRAPLHGNAGGGYVDVVGAGPRACPDEPPCSFEGQPQGVAPTSASVGIGVGVQFASTVALLDTYERTDRLWQRLPGRPLMALMGRVPAKATTQNGPITPGDLLVSSSTPGHVMRCRDPQRCQGALIGKALEPLRTGSGVIEMLLMH